MLSYPEKIILKDKLKEIKETHRDLTKPKINELTVNAATADPTKELVGDLLKIIQLIDSQYVLALDLIEGLIDA